MPTSACIPTSNSSSTLPTSSNQGNRRSKALEKSFRKSQIGEIDDLAWVGRALRRAFPDARSENELCELAAEALSGRRGAVNPRTVRNWLRGENTPHFRYIRDILVLAGAEAVFTLIDQEAAA